MRIKKYLIIVFSIILLSGCGLIEGYQGFKYMANFKPYTNEYEAMKLYGIIKNGKIDRMGVGKNDVDTVIGKIKKLYGINFTFVDQIFPHQTSKVRYYIKFYNDFKIKVNNREYIIPREKVKMTDNDPHLYYTYYDYKIPLNLDGIGNFIFDIGEIEIVNKDGKVIRKKKRIPPFVFKRAKYRKRVLDWQGSSKVYYQGWAENYHEYDKSKEKEREKEG